MSRQQFAFPLADTPHYGAADFLVSACNHVAFDAIRRWPDWPAPVLFLSGPAASGKTHLAHIWAAQNGAPLIPASALTRTAVGEWIAEGRAAGTFVIEEVETLPEAEESALFHLMNAVREQKGSLLLTAAQPASQLGIDLPDLASRLVAAPTAALESPDETVLKAVLMKQFSDRQLRVPDEVLAYLLSRMERSYHAARSWVQRLDEASLAEQRRISVPLVRGLMEADQVEKEPPLL